MFNVPRKYTENKPRPDRDAHALALYKKGMGFSAIAKDPKFIELSGGYALSRQRVMQIIEKFKKEQKSTD